MMTYKTELSMICTYKLKYDSVRNIYPKAPDLMTFWVQFLNTKRGMKRIIFEKLCLFYRLFLDRFREFFEEFIEGFSSGDFHLFIFNKLREGFSFCDSAFFMVFLRQVKEFKELLSVKSCGITECLKTLFTYLQVDTLRSLLGYSCFEFRIHKYDTSLYSYFDRFTILSGGKNVKTANVEKVAYVR